MKALTQKTGYAPSAVAMAMQYVSFKQRQAPYCDSCIPMLGDDWEKLADVGEVSPLKAGDEVFPQGVIDEEEQIILQKPKKEAKKTKKEESELKKEETSDDSEETEDTVLNAIKKLEGEDGAAWDAIIESCKKTGLDEDSIEEALTSLMDKGFIFEPVLGTIKTT